MTCLSKKIIYFILIGLLFSYSLVLVIPLSAKAQSSSVSVDGTHELLIKLKNHEQIYKVAYPDATNILVMQRLVQKMPNVDLVEPNYLLHASYVPNDIFYVEQWNCYIDWYNNQYKLQFRFIHSATPQSFDKLKILGFTRIVKPQ